MWKEQRIRKVAIATWDNPPHGYYDLDGVTQLSAMVETWTADDAVRAVVLTGGTDNRFVTMFSPEHLVMGQKTPLVDRVADGPDRYLRMHDSFSRLTALRKPVIAALNGDAMGIGFTLALASDIRIAQAGDHLYGLPEVKLGLVPGASALQRLSRLIGSATALEFALRGRVVDPQTAHTLGLVHEVVPDARRSALEMAHGLASLPVQAVGLTKYAFYAGMDLRLDDAVSIEAHASMRARLADDAADRITTFVSQPFEDARRWIAEDPHE
ncbi:hypothetical protein GDN83_09740 [Gordonia jinghuaiqii]|uniref:Enoyl-CoA hydratase/isomerase family protein n=1 Tax=Gordonia jinghuaiqii TaxID=2758710 RepID=A0A7D7LRE1_9ACTN|nr:enoyl-CoA hydratase/isomerase family protein [Gordonia jinghuaiqii]MCR5978008.1 hypothetical protein [Gordonia jinghuaiqii]QMT01523.1 enoyl-CoA hydratase/isomerase family protein [Gordonia jinghuaiqii]